MPKSTSQKKHPLSKGAEGTVLLAMLLSAFLACASPEDAWKEATSLDTVASYQAYLDRFEDSEHATEAQARLTYLRDWETALAEDSAAAYRVFLDAHPEGDRSLEARYRHDYRALTQTDDFEEWLAFLSQYADAPNLKSSWGEVEAQVWAMAVEIDAPEEFSKFALALPQSRFASEAAERGRIFTLELLDLSPAKSDCLTSENVTGAIVRLISLWPSVSSEFGVKDVVAQLRDGTSRTVSWILPLDADAGSWEWPAGGDMCGGSDPTIIGEAKVYSNLLNRHMIRPGAEHVFGVRFHRRGSWFKLGFLFDAQADQIERITLLRTYSAEPEAVDVRVNAH